MSETSGSRRIVVGVDGSASSNEALEWAGQQAELTGASIDAVTAWHWPTSYGYPTPVASDFDPAAVATSVLKEATTPLRGAHPGIEIRTIVVEGHPAQVLVDASQDAELLVVGSRGHGEFGGMLLGSVSEFCATHAHCPVLVIRR
jgi:nucleotide-binding universal stress UspA family protein